MSQDTIDPATAAEIVRQEMDKLVMELDGLIDSHQRQRVELETMVCRERIIQRLMAFPELEGEPL